MGSVSVIGRRFGRLVVLQSIGQRGRRYWRAKCDCGATTVKWASSISGGGTKSCGCLLSETTIKKNHRHGLSNHRVYRVWSGMVQRCRNPQNTDWHLYGGRGVSVCRRWEDSLTRFVADMGLPTDGQSLDRIDPNGNYEPRNCRWSTPKEQANNQRKSIRIVRGDRHLTIRELAVEIGKPGGTVRRWALAGKLGRVYRLGDSKSNGR